MKLHEDINAFRVLINDIHERTGSYVCGRI